MMKFNLKRRGSIFLMELLLVTLLLSLSSAGLYILNSSTIKNLQSSSTAYQAQQVAVMKANELSVTPYNTAADEIRALVPNTLFEREVIFGPEVEIAPGNKQKIATINVYKPGDSQPRYMLPVPLSSQGSVSAVPTGTILPWYGDLSAIPDGFAYCDGTNGTPDLRGRTIVGTGQWTDTFGTVTYNLGNQGGERLHKLTIAEMPSHNHPIQAVVHNIHGLSGLEEVVIGSDYRTSFGTTSSNAGGDQPHNNMMPYRAVHWIMKIN